MTPRTSVVLVAHEVHGRGGQERAALELVRELHTDVDFLVVSREIDPTLLDKVAWRRVRAPRRPAPLLFALFYIQATMIVYRERRQRLVHISGAVVANKWDFCTMQFVNTTYRARFGAAPVGVRGIRRLNTILFRTLSVMAETRALRQGTGIAIAVSRGIESELSELNPQLRTTVIPNGVDTSRFRPDPKRRSNTRSHLGIDESDFVAIFVGGDWERKRLRWAMEAVSLMASPGKLIVLGEGDQQAYHRYALDLGIEDSISFLGKRTDVETYLLAADALLLPTSYEAFSLATIEAAASGLPVVGSQANGMQDLVGDEGAHLLVADEFGPPGYARRLDMLASDPAERIRLGTLLRKRALDLSWPSIAAKTLALYSGATK